MIKESLQTNRILIAAVAASLGCHLMWLTMVKVVIKPSNSRSVKFSRISFLGPILERGAIEVRTGTKEMSFLEERYKDTIGRLADTGIHGDADTGAGRYRSGGLMTNSAITGLVDAAVSGSKLEPSVLTE